MNRGFFPRPLCICKDVRSYVRKSGFCTSYCFRVKITSMEQHQEYLNRLCRVCGRYSRSQRNREPVYKCSEYSSELSRVFEINIAKDLDTVHPSNFCKPCHIVVHTYMKALNEGKVYKYSTVLFSGWGPHWRTGAVLVST